MGGPLQVEMLASVLSQHPCRTNLREMCTYQEAHQAAGFDREHNVVEYHASAVAEYEWLRRATYISKRQVIV
jgi:hypothetical protein